MSKLDLTLEQVAALAGDGRIVGDGSFRCSRVASLEAAESGDLSFVRDNKAEQLVADSGAGALVVARQLRESDAHQLIVPDVMAAMIRVLEHVGREKRRQPAGIDARAVVDEEAELGSDIVVGAGAVICRGARIGDRTVVYANAYVGARSRIGDDSIIYPNVSIMEDVRIGDRVIVHSGTVIGCDGYGFVAREGRQVKVPQVGEIVIGDDVEIGACATIDRATIAATVIGDGVKIGDLVHIAHNVEVGDDSLLLPTVAISGSTKLGRRVIFAGRAACSGHLTIGDDAVLGATTVAFKDVEPGAVLWGNPAREKTTEMRIQLLLPRLPDMVKELRELRRAVARSENSEEVES